jgi:hypothetical protein
LRERQLETHKGPGEIQGPFCYALSVNRIVLVGKSLSDQYYRADLNRQAAKKKRGMPLMLENTLS